MRSGPKCNAGVLGDSGRNCARKPRILTRRREMHPVRRACFAGVRVRLVALGQTSSGPLGLRCNNQESATPHQSPRRACAVPAKVPPVPDFGQAVHDSLMNRFSQEHTPTEFRKAPKQPGPFTCPTARQCRTCALGIIAKTRTTLCWIGTSSSTSAIAACTRAPTWMARAACV